MSLTTPPPDVPTGAGPRTPGAAPHGPRSVADSHRAAPPSPAPSGSSAGAARTVETGRVQVAAPDHSRTRAEAFRDRVTRRAGRAARLGTAALRLAAGRVASAGRAARSVGIHRLRWLRERARRVPWAGAAALAVFLLLYPLFWLHAHWRRPHWTSIVAVVVLAPLIVWELWYTWGADPEVWLARHDQLASVAAGAAIVLAVLKWAAFRRQAIEAERRASHYRAWQTLNSAHGRPGNGGRLDALQELARDGVSLDGVNLDGAWLRQLDLPYGARLNGASFRPLGAVAVDLTWARLRGAELAHAHLEEAWLMGARLEGALLMGAHLQGADLREANLEGADLREAHLEGAQLGSVSWDEGTRIRGANIYGLQGAPEEFREWALTHGAMEIPPESESAGAR